MDNKEKESLIELLKTAINCDQTDKIVITIKLNKATKKETQPKDSK